MAKKKAKKSAATRKTSRKKSASKRTRTGSNRKKAAGKTKKKATRKKKPTARRKKTSVKKKAGGRSSARSAGTNRSKTARKKKKAVKKSAAQRAIAMGRPRIPADARLDLVFQKDYRAREIFAFLGVRTVRELEQFGPQEIIDRLTGPMIETVERIRKALALNNRSLAGDRDFALEFREQWRRRR